MVVRDIIVCLGYFQLRNLGPDQALNIRVACSAGHQGVASDSVFMAMLSNGSLSQKWAKVRIRSDERRHKGLPEPPEDEFEPGLTPEWLFLAIIFLLICMLLSKV